MHAVFDFIGVYSTILLATALPKLVMHTHGLWIWEPRDTIPVFVLHHENQYDVVWFPETAQSQQEPIFTLVLPQIKASQPPNDHFARVFA